MHSPGATLTALPEETWATSVAMWRGTHWDVLINLWTVEEGRSDLVLLANLYEDPSGYRCEVVMVYVP